MNLDCGVTRHLPSLIINRGLYNDADSHYVRNIFLPGAYDRPKCKHGLSLFSFLFNFNALNVYTCIAKRILIYDL